MKKEDEARLKVFALLAHFFSICKGDCPDVSIKENDGLTLVFGSGGTFSETLEWRASSWSALAALMEREPEGIIYDDEAN